MMKSTRYAAAALAVFAFSASAWAQNPGAPSTLQIKPPPAAEKVVAVVGDEKITSTELDGMVRAQLRGRSVPPEAMANVRKAILESMIQNKLVTQYVEKQDIDVTKAEIDETIAGIKKQLNEAGADLAALLQAQSLTEEGLRDRLESELAVEKYVKSQVTEQKAKEYFQDHKKEFDGTEVKASHILLKYEEDAAEAEKKAARDKIAVIRQEIVTGGDFAEAAKKHSQCPSSAEGGNLDFFPRHGMMVEPFAAAAFDLAPGAISQPVETPFGVHLIKVTDVKPGELKFDEVKDEVLGTLYQQLLEEAAAEQRKQTKVEILS